MCVCVCLFVSLLYHCDCLQANVAFQEAEFERISKLKVCMKNFCELERTAINARSELLKVLEDAINSQNAEDDLSLFISQEKNTELTHKYTNAVNLMDLHLKKKYVAHLLSFLVSLCVF